MEKIKLIFVIQTGMHLILFVIFDTLFNMKIHISFVGKTLHFIICWSANLRINANFCRRFFNNIVMLALVLVFRLPVVKHMFIM